MLPGFLCLLILIRRHSERQARIKPALEGALSSILVLLILVIGFISINNYQSKIDEAARYAQDDLTLYEWALAESDVDALFYFNSLEFRFRAQRSITHSWKDLALAYYSRTQLVPFYKRYLFLEDMYRDSEILKRTAIEYEADYLIIEGRNNIFTNLSTVYENDSYTVYKVR